MKAYIQFTFPLTKQVADQRLLDVQQLKASGTGVIPDPPRDVSAQPGSRGALLTWKLPPGDTSEIRGWRIYKETENNLIAEVQDPGRRQSYVSLSSGTTPPVTNFFISAITAKGAESTKVVVQAQALAEAGAPTVPNAPPGFASEDPGGGSQNYYGRSPGGVRPTFQ